MASLLYLEPESSLDMTVTTPKQMLLEASSITIGRGSAKVTVDFVISLQRSGSEIISRKHALIARDKDGGYAITDLNSLNGTFVNDVRVKSQSLLDGDIIQFGGVSNVPTGTVLSATSDVCLRYKFVFPNKRRKLLAASDDSPASITKHSTSSIAGDTVIERVTPDSSTAVSSAISLQEVSNLHEEISKLKTLTDSLTSQLSSHETEKQDYLSKITLLEKRVADFTAACAGHVVEETRLKSLLEAAVKQRKLEVASTPSTPSVPATPASASRSPSLNNTPKMWSLSGDSVKSFLSCALCSHSIIDAAVLRCSHGFCRACIECYWRGESTSSYGTYSSGNGSGTKRLSAAAQFSNMVLKKKIYFCPICKSSSKKSDAAPRKYNRSEQLDNMVWLLMENSIEQAKKEFEVRVQKHRHQLVQYGIDPDDMAASANEDDDEEGGGKGGGGGESDSSESS